jgi:hypothetical protein
MESVTFERLASLDYSYTYLIAGCWNIRGYASTREEGGQDKKSAIQVPARREAVMKNSKASNVLG